MKKALSVLTGLLNIRSCRSLAAAYQVCLTANLPQLSLIKTCFQIIQDFVKFFWKVFSELRIVVFANVFNFFNESENNKINSRGGIHPNRD